MKLLNARATVYMARHWYFGNLVPENAAELSSQFLQARSPGEARRLARLDRPVVRQMLNALEYLTIPGFSLHVAVRKCAIERFVRAAIAEGARQVVSIAPEFDTLASRLHKQFADVGFYELDLPNTQRIKRRALTAQWSPSNNLRLISIESLHDQIGPLLRRQGFDPMEPTVFVTEGLLAHLEARERDRLFDLCRTLGTRNSRIVFTFMEREPNGRIHYHGATWMARLLWNAGGQPFRWGPSHDELKEYLGARTMRLRELAGAEEFRMWFLDGDHDVPLAGGESVAVADIGAEPESD